MNEHAISLTDSSVRRMQTKMQGWWRWILEHTFDVRRNDGTSDKTVLAWRGAVTAALGAILSGLTYLIMQVSNGVKQPSVEQRLSGIEDGVKELKQQTTRLEEQTWELTTKARRFDRFIDGFDSSAPAKTK